MAVLVAVTSASGIGSGSISASASLAATGFTARSGVGAIPATGSLSADAVGAEPPAGDGSVSATGAMTATGRPIFDGSGAVEATGTLTATGDTLTNEGSGAISTVGAMTAGGRLVPVGSGNVAGIGTMTGVGGGSAGGGLRFGSGFINSNVDISGNGFRPNEQPLGPRRVVFRLDNRFVTGGLSPASELDIANRLSQYVSDCNVILGKTTSLVLTYDPNFDCTFHDPSEFPFSFHQNPSAIPNDWYYEWPIALGSAATSLASSSGTAAGYMSPMSWGAVSVAWNAIWSDSEKDSSDPLPSGFGTVSEDYVGQLYLLLHEGGHGLNLGIGEYYSSNIIRDFTGVEPDLSSNLVPGIIGGIYWDARPLAQLDPMAQRNIQDRASYLVEVEFGPLSSFIINEVVSGNRSETDIGYPDYDHPEGSDGLNFEITVEVRSSAGGAPIQGATVDMYYSNRNTFTSVRLDSPATETQVTDSNGRASFIWGVNTSQSVFSVGNQFRAFKVSAAGFDNNADGVSCWDLNAHEIFGGGVAGDFTFSNPLVIELDPA